MTDRAKEAYNRRRVRLTAIAREFSCLPNVFVGSDSVVKSRWSQLTKERGVASEDWPWFDRYLDDLLKQRKADMAKIKEDDR